VIGRRLSQYELLAVIGEGGMGVVYKAHDTRLNRLVAIKVLNAQHMADPERRRRFVQEAKAASALNHRNIVSIYDINTEDGIDFIAMEYIHGHTLDHLIGRTGLAPARALDYAIQMAGAFSKAHAAGIVHRDIKPSNVMVNEDGIVKVLDFGVAKLVAVDHGLAIDDGATTRTVSLNELPQTTEGRVIGTIAYMSPEQAAGQAVDARSDIFSFGAVLYEMVTGVRAFAGSTSVSTLAALLSGEPKRPSELVTGVARDFERIILRCLRKDPARRFQVMADLVVELEELKTDSGAAGGPEKAAAPANPWRTTVLVGIPLLLVALAAGAFWLLKDSGPPPPRSTVDQLTSYPGDERYPNLSPDGRQVAFAWSGAKEDNFDIYIKPLGAEIPLRLTTDAAEDGVPAWSPDGSRIAFVRRGRNQTAVYLTPPVPGAERKVADFQPSATQIGRMSVSWTPDGNWIAVATIEANGPALSLMPAAGGSSRILLSNPGAEGSYVFPAVAPGGQQVAYGLCTTQDKIISDANPCDVYVVDLDGQFNPRGQPRRLTRQLAMLQGITWAPDERSVIYGSLSGGRTSASGHLWRVQASGGSPERLELAAAGEFPSVSRTGNSLAYARDRADYDLLKFDEAGSPSSLFSSSTNDYDPQLSPDGTQIAFATDRAGKGREIWVATLDGSAIRPVAQATGRELGSPRWSPDGRWLVFDGVGADGNWDIYIVDSAGGQPKQLTTHPGFENFPSWSSDGRWIYYRSTRSGASEVWRMHPDGGGSERLTTQGGAAAWESWDGKTLYYTRHDGGGSKGESVPLLARPVNGGPERQILDGVLRWDFAPVKGGIYFIAMPQPRVFMQRELRFLNVATGKVNLVTRFQVRAGQGLTASLDGKTIFYSGIGPAANSDLLLIHNFR